MKPDEFPWSEDQTVTVTNPTAETFKFKVHSKEYELGAGKSAKMPGYIAWVYVYGMASQLCQADDDFMRWNEEGFRQSYYEKIYSGFDPIMEEVVAEEPSLVQPVDDEPDEPADTPSAADVADSIAAEEDEQEPEESVSDSSGVVPMKAKATRGRATSRA